MTAVFLILAAALLFAVMSFFLFRGKGGWLIAGYNTAPEAVKRRYDKRKLCRAAGFICLTAAVLLGLMALFGFLVETGRLPESAMLWFGLGFAVVILAVTAAAIRSMNKSCRR